MTEPAPPLTKRRVARFLVDLEERGDTAPLSHGGGLIEAAGRAGLLDGLNNGWDVLARQLAALKADSAIRFDFFPGPNQPPEPPAAFFDNSALQKCQNFSVLGPGYALAREDRATIAIHDSVVGNVAGGDIQISLTALFERWEEEVATLDAPEGDKQEARTRIRRAKELLADTGQSVVSEVIAAALRQSIGL